MTSKLVLYDGVCGLCSGVVQWVLPRDRRGIFQFAPLQSRLAFGLLMKHGIPVGEDGSFDTFVIIDDHGGPSERALVRSRGALALLGGLGGIYRVLADVGRVVPAFLLDAVYRFIAERRYAWFGRADACFLPSPAERDRFLGLDDLAA